MMDTSGIAHQIPSRLLVAAKSSRRASIRASGTRTEVSWPADGSAAQRAFAYIDGGKS